jgi:hypothetical protein
MNRRLIGLSFAAACALAGSILAPAGASADTVTIGSALNHPSTPALCTGCVAVQNGNSTGLSPHPFKSPANGTVTSWRVRSGDMNALYTLRILRQTGSTTFLSAGQVTAPTAVPNTVDQAREYPASLPISQGDSIGLAMNAGHDIPDYFTGDLLDVDAYAPAPPFPDGTTGTFTGIQQHELLLQATVKFCKVPNVVGQAQAAATAAVAAGDCTSTVSTQSLRLKAIKKSFSKSKKKKVKKQNAALKAQDGKVISQSIAAGTTSASPGPAVDLKVGKVVKPPKKKKKH